MMILQSAKEFSKLLVSCGDFGKYVRQKMSGRPLRIIVREMYVDGIGRPVYVSV
jgi:hypothetical protein